MTSYSQFLLSKRRSIPDAGFDIPESDLNAAMFPFQRPITSWALRRGRAALFLDTGLGKTLAQLEWAAHVHNRTGGNVLILAPLAVGRQTLGEAEKFGITSYVPIQLWNLADIAPGITITNYEKLHKLNPADFTGVVLDESSILKSLDGKTKKRILTEFRNTPYKLACTATPAPNDQMELGNHAEFLGIMSRSEMLSMFFIHDGGDTSKWRLKGHAEADFWKWMATWSVMIQRPSDIGFEDDRYDLPELHIHDHVIETKTRPGFQTKSGTQHSLFQTDAKTLSDKRKARRDTIIDRTAVVADLVNNSSEPWVVWCGLNDESSKAAETIPDGVEIRGSLKDYEKESRLIQFVNQEKRCLITKTKIAGFGLNFQFCSDMAFLGINDSYESFYQAVRRIWRFGQTKPCDIHVVTSDRDAGIVANIQRKQRDHEKMVAGMIEAMSAATMAELGSATREETEYEPAEVMQVPEWMGS